ncbi:hypothetical protein MN116_005452 [Schistosoma mekongi]|uniref:Uncharacterized protein n=1 Tax=Schistosoma mekongi TaxID=38744 RepID=A0AAE1ZDN1_SCHME|nr:hypothetical protein MN116_005452 [Schistosoma mekongi]
MYPFKIKQSLRIYPFLSIFVKINIFTIFIYFLLIIINNYRFPNINYHASIIRDREELRLAHSRTLIYEWYHQGGKLPFIYPSSSSSSSTVMSTSHNKHGLLISIMSSNYLQSRQIDDYQPDYLTQSLSTLIKLIFDDITKYGYRFKYIRIMICLNGTNLHQLSNVNEIIRLIGHNAIHPLLSSSSTTNHLLSSYMNLSINCQIIQDMSSCMLKSFDVINHEQNLNDDYILILQEDMFANDNLFDLLWHIMQQQSMNNTSSFGMIQLYSRRNVMNFPFYHNTDRQLFEIIFMCILCITFIVFFNYLRYLPVRLPTSLSSSASLSWRYHLYKFYLILCLIFTLFILISLYGVKNVLIRLSNLFIYHNQNILFQLKGQVYYAKSDLIMASLYSVKQIKQIGYYLKSIAPCEQFLYDLKQDELKCAQLITSYLLSNIKQIFSVHLNLFKHYGLYSFNEKRILNPKDVE